MSNELVADFLREKFAEQPLVKRYANTVTTAVGALVAVVWTLISAGVDLPSHVTTGVLVLVSIGTVIGVKFTPNGITERQIAEVEEYVGKHRAAE